MTSLLCNHLNKLNWSKNTMTTKQDSLDKVVSPGRMDNTRVDDHVASAASGCLFDMHCNNCELHVSGLILVSILSPFYNWFTKTPKRPLITSLFAPGKPSMIPTGPWEHYALCCVFLQSRYPVCLHCWAMLSIVAFSLAPVSKMSVMYAPFKPEPA